MQINIEYIWHYTTKVIMYCHAFIAEVKYT